MKPANLLFILSDQHRRDVLGCYGNPLVQTPNLDGLAHDGTRFARAYTNCPICVPARASLATGRHLHQLGNWDNAFPYDGSVPSWGHRLKEQGFTVDSIGKLHFRSSDDDNGFTREIDPLHVVEGIGDLAGSIRSEPPMRNKRSGIIGAGPGDSSYLRYDAGNTAQACRWLDERASVEAPWVLFLSYACPHPPYIAPEDLYDLYPPERIGLPVQWRPEDWPDHPAQRYARQFRSFDEPFDETEIRRLSAAYYALCTYLDKQVGEVLAALDRNGLRASTRIVYTSDHGECLGARGLFGKFTMYEESAAIPLILSGPDVPACRVVDTPVSLVDCFPTVLEAVGLLPGDEDDDLPGRSLWRISREEDWERTVLSQYHAVGSRNAVFMLCDSRYKYVHYVHEPPQLFDLERDPHEIEDLSTLPNYQALLERFEGKLRAMLDPESTDAIAKADQRAKVDAFGGREAVLARGTFDNSPVPGEAPEIRHGSK
ncbi:MAG: sulfatase-like hydrolase/transferase [Trueperaceae bacterium]